MPPLIALVSYRLEVGRIRGWRAGGYAVPDRYIEALGRAGARAAILPPSGSAPEVGAEEILAPFDGLLLVGGGDIEPRRFGEEPHPTVWGLEPDRDDLELELLREADRVAMPTLAICRGAQALNVAFGGTLLQHLPDIEGTIAHGAPDRETPPLHDVRLEPGSRIAEAVGVETLSCSSHHHQGVGRLGGGLVATGWSDDGLIEALERHAGWMVGTQWHPEDTASDDAAQQRIFDTFVGLAAS